MSLRSDTVPGLGAEQGLLSTGRRLKHRGGEFWAIVALTAALGAYLLHHLPPLGDHELLAALLVVGAGASLGALGGLFAVARQHSPPPEVLLARPSEVDIRTTRTADLSACASLHADGLPGGFFVALGPAFLRAYHRTFVLSPHAVTFVAVVRGQPVGLLTGLLRPQAHMRWALQRGGVHLAMTAGLALVTRPRSTWRFAATRLRRYTAAWRRHRGAESTPPTPPTTSPAVLSHVVVSKGARGAGLGERLVEVFVGEVGRAGVERVTLTTSEGSGGAAGFYLRLGWREAGSRTTADATRVSVFDLDIARGPR